MGAELTPPHPEKPEQATKRIIIKKKSFWNFIFYKNKLPILPVLTQRDEHSTCIHNRMEMGKYLTETVK